MSWHWIFLLNVPVGIVATILAFLRLDETYGPEGRLDLVGLGLASAGLLGVVWGVINGNERGWTDPQIVAAVGVGAVLLLGFVGWEARTRNPMIPIDMFRSRAFAAANTASLLMYFGMFGSIFLLSQFFQIVQGYNPFETGIRVLPWTAMPAVVAPLAGYFSGRIGARPILVVGLALMSLGLGWIAAIASPTAPYIDFVPAFVVSGIGMGMFFAPIANLVLSAVRREQEGKASGANNAIREVGGVFGVAVLASVFSANGSYVSPQAFVDGMVPAVWLGSAAVAVAAVAALAIPRRVAAGQPRVVDGAAGAEAFAGSEAA